VDTCNPFEHRALGGIQRAIGVGRKGERDVARSDGATVVPGRSGTEPEPKRDRVDPLPGRGEPRKKLGAVDRRSPRYKVGQTFVHEIADVSSKRGADERRKERIGIPDCRDHQRAAAWAVGSALGTPED